MRKPLNRQTAAVSSSFPVKVLQFGEGNFLRAFSDWMIDILNEETDFMGSVRIVQPLESGMAEVLNRQDGLYHVVLNGIRSGIEVTETRLITCVRGAINPYTDFAAYLKEAENPSLQFIISNTTEAGITFSAEDTDPAELATTYPGKLTTLLHHRFRHFQGSSDSGLIFLPCELIDRNGEQLKTAILRYASHWGLSSGFVSWINEHNTFCNTLVDRIVPGFPADSIDRINEATGFEDQLVVKAEPFHLWVIEEPASVSVKFPTLKTSLDVKFVNDLTPYRTRKVRILNGAHTAMVPVAYMKGLRTVQEAVEDQETGVFIRNLIYSEIIPTLDLPEEELSSFAGSVLERFLNPFIRHELISIALNSVSKFKVRVLPSILEYHKRKGTMPSLLMKSLASLICFYAGNYGGQAIPLKDSQDVLDKFNAAWGSDSVDETVSQILSDESLWDQDLTRINGILSAVTDNVRALLNAQTKTVQSSV
jgi:tagaturonate reductase